MGKPPGGREQRQKALDPSTKLLQDMARIVSAAQYCEGRG